MCCVFFRALGKKSTRHHAGCVECWILFCLGRLGYVLASLFHYDPQFHGKRAMTFHCQRDYIFVRHHRYEFKSTEKCKLRELGPRFTLKLRSLQKGTFDSKTGEYDWIISNKRHELETGSRRRFYL